MRELLTCTDPPHVSAEAPRVIAVDEIVYAKVIDGNLRRAIEAKPSDERAFAVLLMKKLAVELRDQLNEALGGGR